MILSPIRPQGRQNPGKSGSSPALSGTVAAFSQGIHRLNLWTTFEDMRTLRRYAWRTSRGERIWHLPGNLFRSAGLQGLNSGPDRSPSTYSDLSIASEIVKSKIWQCGNLPISPRKNPNDYERQLSSGSASPGRIVRAQYRCHRLT
jgi:hypothetical protein